jgi:transposase
MTFTARNEKHSVSEVTLHVAFELGNSQWKLGFTTGLAQQARVRTVAARDRQAVLDEVANAKKRFGLAVDAHAVSCYDEVNRRARRAKTDRLDVGKLLGMLLRYRSGERRLWSVLHVPSVTEEDERQLHRELTTAKRERVRLVNRMRGLLIAHGVEMDLRGAVVGTLERVELWDGSLLPAGIRARLVRDCEQLQLLVHRIGELETQRRERLRSSSDPVVDKVRQLMALRGIGPNSAWLFVMEFSAGGSSATAKRSERWPA